MDLFICKLSISMLYINLYIVYSITGSYIPHGTLIFGGAAVLSFIIYIIRTGCREFRTVMNEVLLMAGFYIVAVLGMIYTAYDQSSVLNTMISCFEKYVFALIICLICLRENSIEFPVKLFSLIIIASAISP